MNKKRLPTGAEIRRRRETRGWSRPEMVVKAKEMKLRLSVRTIATAEKGEDVSARTLGSIARVLDCSVDEISQLAEPDPRPSEERGLPPQHSSTSDRPDREPETDQVIRETSSSELRADRWDRLVSIIVGLCIAAILILLLMSMVEVPGKGPPSSTASIPSARKEPDFSLVIGDLDGDQLTDSVTFPVDPPPPGQPSTAELYGQGLSHMGRMEFDAAVDRFEKMLSRNANDHRAIFNRGYIRMIRGEYEAARQDFERVIELEPKAKSAYNILAHLNLSLGKHDAAVEICTAGLATPSPASVTAQLHYRRGCAYSQLAWKDPKLFEKALGEFDVVLRDGFESYQVYRDRSRVLEKLGRTEEAKASMDRAKALGYEPRRAAPREPGT